MTALNRIFAFIANMLSEDGNISFARGISGYLVVFFTAMDAWYFHRKGVFIDNATLATQLSVMVAFYGVNKAHDAVTTNKQG